MKVYPFIEAEKASGHKVEQACARLEVSRSAYYAWRERRKEPTRRAREDEVLAKRVAQIHRTSRGTYGVPRILAQLRQEGIRSSKKRIGRLMTLLGLAGRTKRRTRKTTEADPGAEGVQLDLLNRGFQPGQSRPDEAWVGDITYLRTTEGWSYLATVIDLASRTVVGHAMAEHMKSGLVCDALRMAVARRKPAPGLIFHSDRGSQYTSRAYRELLQEHGMRQSLSRPRQCWDNAVAESFFATLKVELVYRQPIPTRMEARSAVFDYVEVFYNRQRLHSSLGYRSPVDYENWLLTSATATHVA